ncbi:hypothetical protein Tco_0120107 [Tanacetum coccineum]
MSEFPNNGFMNLLTESMTPEQYVEYEHQEPIAVGRWLPVEEELLATCYVAVSEDNNVGRSQKHETLKNFQNRTKDMLTSKWHTLNANCQKFNAAYKRAKRWRS